MNRATTTCSALLFLVACGEGSTPIEREPPPESSSAPTRWVEISAPRDGTLLEAPAVARANATAAGEVAVTHRGRVEQVHVRLGELVDPGDPIVDVGSSELLAAAATYTGAVRRLAVHTARVEELESLRGEGLVRSADVFTQRAAATDLRAERDSAAATLRGAGVNPRSSASILRRGFVTLTAPVAGVIAELRARPGEILEPGGAPVTRIIGEAPARIEVRTAEPWPPATALTFVSVDGRSVELTPAPLATVIDPSDGTRLGWYAPQNGEERFQEGLRGVVRINGTAEVWQVPARAVVQRTGESVVERRRDGEVARVGVQVLATSGAAALVRGELREGDEVAADAARHEAANRGPLR